MNHITSVSVSLLQFFLAFLFLFFLFFPLRSPLELSLDRVVLDRFEGLTYLNIKGTSGGSESSLRLFAGLLEDPCSNSSSWRVETVLLGALCPIFNGLFGAGACKFCVGRLRLGLRLGSFRVSRVALSRSVVDGGWLEAWGASTLAVLPSWWATEVTGGGGATTGAIAEAKRMNMTESLLLWTMLNMKKC